MSRPKLLDLFCGAGGAGLGLFRAGFSVTGVDIKPQKHYPFNFIQTDAMTFPLEGYDAYWASPPCQGYSMANNVHHRVHPLLISEVRQRLSCTHRPYIIENVIGAPLINPVLLCGLYFGLKIARHRIFESNTILLVQPHYHHNGWTKRGFLFTPYHSYPTQRRNRVNFGNAVQIYHMTAEELTEAIPPAYSEFLGKQLIRYVT